MKQDPEYPILLIKITLGKQKNFSEIYWQLEHALSKMLVRSVPGHGFEAHDVGVGK
jgi:hypothetical protein